MIRKTFCGEPLGYCDPPCSEEHGQCSACEIKDLRAINQKLESAIGEHENFIDRISVMIEFELKTQFFDDLETHKKRVKLLTEDKE